MTYNVLMGTSNPTHSLFFTVPCRKYLQKQSTVFDWSCWHAWTKTNKPILSHR